MKILLLDLKRIGVFNNLLSRKIRSDQFLESGALSGLVDINFPLESTKIVEQLDIGPWIVRSILNDNRCHCSQLRTTNDIFPEHSVRSEDMFISYILFTDESSFSLQGRHNPSKTVGYSRENIHLKPHRIQNPKDPGIMKDSIIEPYFIVGVQVFENVIPNIRSQHDNYLANIRSVEVTSFCKLYFQIELLTRRYFVFDIMSSW